MLLPAYVCQNRVVSRDFGMYVWQRRELGFSGSGLASTFVMVLYKEKARVRGLLGGEKFFFPPIFSMAVLGGFGARENAVQVQQNQRK